MAEAFANYYGKGIVIAESAGVKLADKVNPVAVEVMQEKGIDISKNNPKMLTMEKAKNADFIITMGCGVSDVCPAIIFKEAIDWGLEDPKGKPIGKVRLIRDEIELRVKQLMDEIAL
jgi:arsenate reductase